MNAIVKTESMPLRYEDMERLGASIAKSGLFGIKTTDQAVTLMMIAHAEGRHPALAARDYDIIQGKPAKKAEAMARDFLESGGKIEWHALTDAIADATFSHPRGGTVRIAWDMARAATAGLKDKDTWKKFPRQMLRSRTISEGVRTIWPSATSGMYVPEEAADIPFTGTTIEAHPELPKAAAEPPAAAHENGNGKARHSIAPPAGAPDADWRACLDKVAPALARMRTRALVEEMGDGPTCSDITANGPEWARAELSLLLVENLRRFEIENAPETGELPEVAIPGEKYLAAG